MKIIIEQGTFHNDDNDDDKKMHFLASEKADECNAKNGRRKQKNTDFVRLREG
jgi:riboflavin synthase